MRTQASNHAKPRSPGETEIGITLKQASFCLMSDGTEYKFKIHKAKLYVCRVTINPEIVETHEHAVSAHGPFKFPREPSRAYHLRHSQGNRDHPCTHCNTGQLPSRMLLCFVDHNALSGHFKTKTYELKHWNVNSVQVIMNDQKVPTYAYTPYFSKGQVVREYLALHTETGMY